MCDSALDLLPQTASSKRQCQYSFSGDKKHKEVIIRTLTSFYRLDLGEDSHVSCYTGMGQKHKRLTGQGGASQKAAEGFSPQELYIPKTQIFKAFI